MIASGLLAVALGLNSLQARVVLSLQDNPGTSETQTKSAPTTEPNPAEAKPDAPAEATKAPAPEKPPKRKAEPTGKGASTRRAKHSRQAETLPEDGQPRKVVIRHGGAAEPTAQIVPDLAAEEAIKLREGTLDLLASAGENLKALASRTLDVPKQGTLTQIQDYVKKAQAAMKDGDVRRAHTLALKAQLLADDLVKN